MANLNKYLLEAQKANISPFEIIVSNSTKIEISTYGPKVENVVIANESAVSGRGIYDGKLGSFTSDSLAKDGPSMMVSNIVESATYGRESDPTLFVAKGQKYKKVKSYHPELESLDVALLSQAALKVYEGAKQVENVAEVEVGVNYNNQERQQRNSLGLNLKSKSNYCEIFVQIIVRKGETVESGFDVALINTGFDTFDFVEFGKKAAIKAVSKLGSTDIKSGKYKVILSQHCVAMLASTMLDKLSAYDIKHGVSLFVDTLNKPLFSKKFTVESKPISNSVFASSFDSEGTPKKNMKLIDRGVVKTYLYDLETAKNDGTTSTGSGSRQGANIRPSIDYIVVKPGKKSFEELVATVGEGVYIDSLQGAHAGLNTTSGQFSLQASGKLITNGKIGEPLALITLAGNLVDMFSNILEVGGDSIESYHGATAPSIAFKKLSVSGSGE